MRLLDNFVYGDSAVRDLFGHANLELRIGDCRNIQSVVSAVNGAESIIHLAAIVGDPACEQDKRAALEINYAATRMMIVARCRRAPASGERGAASRRWPRSQRRRADRRRASVTPAAHRAHAHAPWSGT